MECLGKRVSGQRVIREPFNLYILKELVLANFGKVYSSSIGNDFKFER